MMSDTSILNSNYHTQPVSSETKRIGSYKALECRMNSEPTAVESRDFQLGLVLTFETGPDFFCRSFSGNITFHRIRGPGNTICIKRVGDDKIYGTVEIT